MPTEGTNPGMVSLEQVVKDVRMSRGAIKYQIKAKRIKGTTLDDGGAIPRGLYDTLKELTDAHGGTENLIPYPDAAFFMKMIRTSFNYTFKRTRVGKTEPKSQSPERSQQNMETKHHSRRIDLQYNQTVYTSTICLRPATTNSPIIFYDKPNGTAIYIEQSEKKLNDSTSLQLDNKSFSGAGAYPRVKIVKGVFGGNYYDIIFFKLHTPHKFNMFFGNSPRHVYAT